MSLNIQVDIHKSVSTVPLCIKTSISLNLGIYWGTWNESTTTPKDCLLLLTQVSWLFALNQAVYCSLKTTVSWAPVVYWHYVLVTSSLSHHLYGCCLSQLCLWPQFCCRDYSQGTLSQADPVSALLLHLIHPLQLATICARDLVAIHVYLNHFLYQSLSALAGQLGEEVGVSRVGHSLHWFPGLPAQVPPSAPSCFEIAKKTFQRENPLGGRAVSLPDS